MELPSPAPDGNVYVLTKQAAALIRVAPCTIWQWRRKGYLTAIPESPPRKPVYLWEDVVSAEQKARSEAIKASGTTKQVKRDRQ